MRRPFMITCILLIVILFTSACVKSEALPTETAIPPATFTTTISPTEQPTATLAVMTGTPPAGIGGDVSACPPATLPIADWPFYCDNTHGFLIQYPPDSILGTTDAGITHIDLSVLPGTNLGEKYVEITVQENGETCTSPLATGYVPEAVQTEELVINGLSFIKQSGSDAGAGNYYNWIAYSTGRDGMCASFGFVLHSTNRYNYPTPPPEYDFEAETAVIEQMMGSFRWVTP